MIVNTIPALILAICTGLSLGGSVRELQSSATWLKVFRVAVWIGTGASLILMIGGIWIGSAWLTTLAAGGYVTIAALVIMSLVSIRTNRLRYSVNAFFFLAGKPSVILAYGCFYGSMVNAFALGGLNGVTTLLSETWRGPGSMVILAAILGSFLGVSRRTTSGSPAGSSALMPVWALTLVLTVPFLWSAAQSRLTRTRPEPKVTAIIIESVGISAIAALFIRARGAPFSPQAEWKTTLPQIVALMAAFWLALMNISHI